MLNDKRYKVPTKTSPDNQILFIINGLEQKVKQKDKINKEFLEVCKEVIDLGYHLLIKNSDGKYCINKLQKVISKAEEKVK